MKPDLVILSLGAGVQSTAMALMAVHGELEPMPDAGIFADTGWEPSGTMNHLSWLSSPNVLPFPIHMVNNGSIRESLMSEDKTRYAAVPYFLEEIDNRGVSIKRMGRRQCTHEYKLKPLIWKQRELLGKGRRSRIRPGAVECWVGISTDEASRMKPSHAQWITNRWPLIEAGMSRRDCLDWMEKHGYPTPPKSSCIGCPFHSDTMWRDMKSNDPESWADAVLVDDTIRNGETYQSKELGKSKQYMHTSLKPLDEVDLSTAEERGQLNMFENDCLGMCGV